MIAHNLTEEDYKTLNPNKYEDFPFEKKTCGVAYLYLGDVETKIQECKQKIDELSE